MNKGFKTDVSACGVSLEELAQINAMTVRELAADEVFTFNVILCDNEIDRDFERFDDSALEKMAELFVGTTGIFDHVPKSGNQTARIYSAACVREDGRVNSYGEPYVCLKAKAYIPRTAKNADLIADIESGIRKEVSVSCAAESCTCSICGADMRFGGCRHLKGESYDGKLCCGILSDITDAYEWSFVAVPAQINAGVTKSYGKEIVKTKDIIEKIKSGAELSLTQGQTKGLSAYIEKLEKQARDGAVYRKSLISDTVRFAVTAVPSLDPESVEKMCSGVETGELAGIRDAFRKKAGEVIPLTPQLKAETAAQAEDNSDYKF